MKNNQKENNFNYVLIVLCVLVLILIVVVSSKKTNSNTENKKVMSNLSLQTKCADRAAFFYKQGKFEDNSSGISSSYINHWNEKLGKCFIQINSESVNTNYSTIDVLDAFEGKTYATYIGHIVCDNTFTGNTKICQSDSGNIWFDGNNVRNPSDYRVGFGGIINGGIGDTNTQKQFLEHIHPFMND